MFTVVIDGIDIGSKLDFMKAMDYAFGFPPYFGENWDALWDCLTDMYWIDDNQVHLKIVNSEQIFLKLRLEIVSFFEDLKSKYETFNDKKGTIYSFNFEMV